MPAALARFLADTATRNIRRMALNPSTKNRVVSAWMQHVCQQAGRPDLAQSSANWDKYYQALTAKFVGSGVLKMNLDDQQDVLMDCLMQTATPDAVKKFSGEDSDASQFVTYMSSMFVKRLMNSFKKNMTNKVRQQWKPGDSEQTDEEWQDSHVSPDSRPADPEQHLQNDQGDRARQQVLTNLPAILRTFATKFGKKYGDVNGWWPKILDIGDEYGHEYPDGKIPNKEIAAKLGISPAAVSGWVKRLMGGLLKYSKDTNNEALYEVLLAYGNQRKHGLHSADDGWEIDLLSDIFHHKKLKVPTTARRASQPAPQVQWQPSDPNGPRPPPPVQPRRVPAGEVTSITVRSVPDIMSDRYRSRMMLSDRITQGKIDSAAEEFFAYMEQCDDLLETGDGRVVGLTVSTGEIRDPTGRE